MFKTLAAGEIILALALWTAALAGLVQGREPFVNLFYHFAWWPYLLFLDGVLLYRQGESWLLFRTREFLRLAFLSVTAWLVFEACNLSLHNWRYMGLWPRWWMRWPAYALAFATVLPGIFLTSQVLQSLGLGREAQGSPRNLGRWQPWSLMAGAVLLVLPLICPTYAFPLVWLALIFLLDPFCDLMGGESLIVRGTRGERRELLCLAAAGLVCGLWWEMWNYPAGGKWIYTLPVLNSWRVFEMPLLGYLGFIPFALECRVIYNFFNVLEPRVFQTRTGRGYYYLAHLIFWLLMFAAIDHWTVISFK
ncbi:MAG: hypothetical protein FJ134_05235 [Deltaproteobacteria bacterium]|nr:hypothetical protein [Deltaproteobacteria bacterium]